MLIYGDLTEKIIEARVEVHHHLGPGLLERSYQACLRHELKLRKLRHDAQQHLAVEYKGLKIRLGYRLDFVVEQKVLLELKSVAELLPIHQAQLMTYLRLSEKRVGLLVNFNVPRLRDGIVRRVL